MPLAPRPASGRIGTPPPPRPPCTREASPKGGWSSPGAPGGRLYGLDLGPLDEDTLLGADGRASILALGAHALDFDPAREPLVLVHGLAGAPADLQGVVDRLWKSGFQLYAAAYDDHNRRTSKNGDDLALALRALADRLAPRRALTLVAHSMGGIVALRALHRLAVDGAKGLGRFAGVHLLAVDSPWHGFSGPSDRGLDALLIAFARPFLPDGIEDMRAESAMFQGDPGAGDPVERAGLYGVTLPASARVELVFAGHGVLTQPETAGALVPLAAKVVDHVTRDAPVRGDPRLVNLWRAMVSSEQFPGAHHEIESAALAGKLTVALAESLLAKHFPRFPGDHVGVLREAPGGRGLLDHLASRAGLE